jgi:methionine synthase II (cobalamin-independent)
VSRTLSEIVGRRFPTTQTGSYPRPKWNSFDLGGEDIRVALRRADFAEAYADGVRAMIGDQVASGIDVPTDGHLWYDRHEGLISSFLLYPAYHLDGIDVLPEPNPMMAVAGAASEAAFGATWNNVVVTGPVERGTMHLAQLWGVANAVSPRPVKFCSGMGPANLGAWLTDRHYHDKAALYRDLADAYNAEFKDAVAPGWRSSSSTTWASRCTRPRTTRSSSTRSTAPSTASTPSGSSTSATSAAARRSASRPTPGSTSSWPRSCRSTPSSTRSPRPGSPTTTSRCGRASQRQGPRHRRHRHQAPGGGDARTDRGGGPQGARPRPPERIHLTTDCGQFALPRQIARGKLAAMAAAAEQLRSEIGS